MSTNNHINLLLIEIKGITWWKYHETVNKYFDIPSLDEGQLVHPVYYYNQIRDRIGRQENKFNFNFGPDGKTYKLIATNILGFKVPFNDSGDVPEFTEYILEPLFQSLKYVSGDSKIHTTRPICRSAGIITLKEDSLKLPKSIPELSSSHVRHLNPETAISEDVLKALANLSKEFIPPIYCDLIHDAINAFYNSDYMKSVLYAAIAVEVMASNVLDQKFDQLKETSNNHSKFRIRTVYGGDTTHKKDDIYESLTKLSNRGTFKHLLHTVPLYVTGNSLRIDKKSVYDSMLELYELRNRIMHKGKPDELRKNSLSTYELCFKKLNDAIKTFHWFDANGKYPFVKKFATLKPE